MVLSLVTLAPAAIARADAPDRRVARRIVPGLTLIRLTWDDGPVRAFVLRIDLSRNLAPEVAIGDAAYPSASASVAEIADREGAVAAVNGDFGGYRPVGPFVHDGRFVQSGIVPERVVAFSADRTRAFVGRPRLHAYAIADGARIAIDTWNSRAPRGGALAASTAVGGLLEAPPPRTCSARLERATPDTWSRDLAGTESRFHVTEVTCEETAPASGREVVLVANRHGAGAAFLRALAPGDPVRLGWRGRWSGVSDLQAGRPMLLDRGRVVTPSPCRFILCPRHPRTGVGVSVGCEDEIPGTRCVLSYVVVDGRQPGWSVGLTLQAFARLMLRVGAWSAINLDGGGSSAMVVDGRVVNRPSLGDDHPVPAAFLVLRGQDPDEERLVAELTDPNGPSMDTRFVIDRLR